MIRLVTQFDDEKSKLSLATPTCGGCCCCCCCCLVSALTVSRISARNFANVELRDPFIPAAKASIGEANTWMYCPQCKTEYREGFFVCVDCGADLVKERPQEADKLGKNSEREIFFVLMITVFLTIVFAGLLGMIIVFSAEATSVLVLLCVFLLGLTCMAGTSFFY